MSDRLAARVNRTPMGSQSDKGILGVLATYADDTGRRCFPSVATIVRDSGLMKRAVQRTLRRLERQGYIKAVVSSRQHYSTEYELDLTLLAGPRAKGARTHAARKTAGGVATDICGVAPRDVATDTSEMDRSVGSYLSEVSSNTVRGVVSDPPGVSVATPEVAVAVEVAVADSKTDETTHTNPPTPLVCVVDQIHEQPDHSFKAIWTIYPRKEAEANAKRAWETLKPSPELQTVIRKAIEKQSRSRQWADRGVIPHLATWLVQRRWTDELAPMIAPAISRESFDRGTLPIRAFTSTPEGMREAQARAQALPRRNARPPKSDFVLRIEAMRKAHPTWTEAQAMEAVYQWQSEQDLEQERVQAEAKGPLSRAESSLT